MLDVRPSPTFLNTTMSSRKSVKDDVTTAPGRAAFMLDFQALNDQFEDAAPQDILRWAADCFGDQLTVVTSFQPTGIVTLHMLQEIVPNTTVMTLDTGLLFPETYALIDEVEARLNLNLIRVKPQQTVAEQAVTEGDHLWSTNPDRCCNIRKTVPLRSALSGYGAWITGLRRDQSEGRKATPIVSWDKRNGLVKLSPLANWTERMVWTYLEAYELPYNALHDQNYFSIGCAPCTQPVAEGQDIRAGRWAGLSKTECGIHLQTQTLTTPIIQPTAVAS
jgi:phosphoadenosine phosphosulfate reductase